MGDRESLGHMVIKGMKGSNLVFTAWIANVTGDAGDFAFSIVMAYGEESSSLMYHAKRVTVGAIESDSLDAAVAQVWPVARNLFDLAIELDGASKGALEKIPERMQYMRGDCLCRVYARDAVRAILAEANRLEEARVPA